MNDKLKRKIVVGTINIITTTIYLIFAATILTGMYAGIVHVWIEVKGCHWL